MRTLLVLVLCVGCTGTTGSTPPPAGAGSQPAAVAPAAAEDAPKDMEQAPENDKAAEGPPPGVKAPGNLPVRTEAELRAEAEAREACMGGCDQEDWDCKKACEQAHPSMQVEVIPDF